MARYTQFRDRDCWRTWFIDECEEAGLFGINEKHLDVLRRTPYRVGTRIYLDDAPVFPASQQRFHRVVGPYEVQALGKLPEDARVIYSFEGKGILYFDPHAELGPWHNRTRVRHDVSGLVMKFRQMASRFNFYPYRFRTRRSASWKEEYVLHTHPCELLD
jgi:hypothetical protein